MRKIKDVVFERILNKFDDGTFTMGENCSLRNYYFEDRTIHSFSYSERTPEVCASLLHYSQCSFSDVPESSRTREFFIDTFSDKDVNKYIINHIDQFDRQFFKDLIVTNKYATSFETNCFNVMPLEYIDDEMVSLAILHTNNWASYEWLLSVIKRKKDAISEDVWKLAARLYVRNSGDSLTIFHNTPEEYKDEEYFFELCLCNFNEGMSLDTNKGAIMELVPEEYFTSNFIVRLINDDIKNTARFNEEAFNMELPVSDGTRVIVWQYMVLRDGYLVSNLPLNDERIEFFLKHYGKQSGEYNFGFKRNYKEYMKKKNNPVQFEEQQRNNAYRDHRMAANVFHHSVAFAIDGEDPMKAVDLVSNMYKQDKDVVLPIRFHGMVPDKYADTHDREEYLEMIYKKMGIQILGEEDRLFFSVILPEGWTVSGDRYWYKVLNAEGEEMIQYFYDPKFYDMDAYVSDIVDPEDIKKKTLQ